MVKVYTTPNCPACNQVKQFLSEQGVKYTAFDVTSDMQAMQDFAQLQIRSVPVTVIGENVIIGFNKKELQEALSN